MKNFPHQFSDLFRLSNGLKVFSELQMSGEDLTSDETVGLALARAGVYTFRGEHASVEDAIAEEMGKPRSDRGTHTAARDLRRMFLLVGFLGTTADGVLVVSASGEQLVDALDAGRKSAVLHLWGESLREMVLGDSEQGVSHPYRILLRLVRSRPGLMKRYLALALEARDDSEGEFRRLLSLIDLGDWDAALQAIGVSGYRADNALKILPSIAEQLEDIRKDGDQCFPGLPDEVTVQAVVASAVEQVPSQPRSSGRRRRRTVTAEEIARLAAPDEAAEAPEREWDPAVLEQAIELQRERTVRHQRLVRRFARLCEEAGLGLAEDPFDCLATGPGDRSILAEMKTLSGEPADERRQVQRALAQLMYYEAFDLPAEVARGQIARVAVFETPISSEHCQFLRAHGIKPAWATAQGLAGDEGSITSVTELLPS